MQKTRILFAAAASTTWSYVGNSWIAVMPGLSQELHGLVAALTPMVKPRRERGSFVMPPISRGKDTCT